AYESAEASLLALSGPGQARTVAESYLCQVQVNTLHRTRPWLRNPATDRLLELWTETGAELGMAVGPEERGGLSDGNSLWDAVPTLDGLGPWGDNDHWSERSQDGS